MAIPALTSLYSSIHVLTPSHFNRQAHFICMLLGMSSNVVVVIHTCGMRFYDDEVEKVHSIVMLKRMIMVFGVGFHGWRSPNVCFLV